MQAVNLQPPQLSEAWVYMSICTCIYMVFSTHVGIHTQSLPTSPPFTCVCGRRGRCRCQWQPFTDFLIISEFCILLKGDTSSDNSKWLTPLGLACLNYFILTNTIFFFSFLSNFSNEFLSFLRFLFAIFCLNSFIQFSVFFSLSLPFFFPFLSILMSYHHCFLDVCSFTKAIYFYFLFLNNLFCMFIQNSLTFSAAMLANLSVSIVSIAGLVR